MYLGSAFTIVPSIPGVLDLSLWSLLKNILTSFSVAGRHFVRCGVGVLFNFCVTRVIPEHFSKLQLLRSFSLA